MAEEESKSRKKTTGIYVPTPSQQEMNVEKFNSDESAVKTGNTSGLRVGSLLRVWAEVSRINYFPSQPLDIITLG